MAKQALEALGHTVGTWVVDVLPYSFLIFRINISAYFTTLILLLLFLIGFRDYKY